jgi:hypothetical protein
MPLARSWSSPATSSTVEVGDAVTVTPAAGAPGFNLGADSIQTPTFITAPSNTSTAVGASVNTTGQNTTGADAVLGLFLNVTAASVATISVGVSSASPVATTTNVVTSWTNASSNLVPLNLYVPNNYFYVVNTSQANGSLPVMTAVGQWYPV